MSNDAIQPERGPLPISGAPVPPAAGAAQIPALGPPSDPKKPRRRLIVPGILIIIIGLLNLVPGLFSIWVGSQAHSVRDADLEEAYTQRLGKETWEQTKKEGHDVAWVKRVILYWGIGCGVYSALVALAAVIGGGCMVAGRSLLLCSIGALAAILSPGGCGILGLVVGIWAMVVLFSEEVRTALRAP